MKELLCKMKCLFLFLVVMGWHSEAKAQKSEVQVYYTCVMHPQIRKDKPGNCPICGMTLIKKTIRKSVPQPSKPQKKTVAPVRKPPAVMKPKDSTEQHELMKDSSGMAPMDMQKEETLKPPKVYLQKGKTVRYDLYVTDTMVNFTGKLKHAYAINGTIPGPELVFTEGDTAEIYLHNRLKSEETSLHWHGVILPNRFDGVPYLTTARIGPGESHLYKFPVVQNGTYWYHSHTMHQEQAGLYGALIFKKREETVSETGQKTASPQPEYTLVLSEWTDEKPSEVQRRLRSANDWYAIKKGSVQSYAEAVRSGYFKTKLTNEWKRMKAMDLSDVYYDRFLANGSPQKLLPQFSAGDRVKIRVVNGSSSTYFWLQYAGGKITVVGNDGNDVQPVTVDRLIIGIAETYDVLVTVPENMSYEFRATAEDRTGAASLWLGSGMKMPAPVLPRLKYFEGMKMMNSMMKMNGNMKDMGMKMGLQKMDMNSVMYPEITEEGNEMQMDSTDQEDTSGNMPNMKSMDLMHGSSTSGIQTLNYSMLRSTVKTILPEIAYKELRFELTGNMNRYVWSINNKTVNEWDKIKIERGMNVRIILFNNSMMRHPMHLHGHDFRVVNGQGEYAPLKNVLDIMPMETDTIEFAGSQTGDWFFHCHILYHMMAGMGNVFSYINSPVNPELPDAEKAFRMFQKDNHMMHLMATIGVESNGSDAEYMLNGNRYAFKGLWHLGYQPDHGYEAELNFGRYFGKMQWWFPYIGFDYHYKKIKGLKTEQADYRNLFGQINNKDDRKTFVAGVQYVLPLLIVADARIDADGKARFQLSREDIPVTSRLRLNIMGNSDREYTVGFRYILKKWLAVSSHYDSDMGLGAGITLTY